MVEKNTKSDQVLLQTIDIQVEKSLAILKFKKEIVEKENDIRLSELVLEKMLEMFKDHPGIIYSLIIDLTDQRGYSGMPSVSRKNYAELGKHKQLKRVAIVGGGVMIRTVASFIVRLTGARGDSKWFKTVDLAKKWLVS